jgi:hypothetical protein
MVGVSGPRRSRPSKPIAGPRGSVSENALAPRAPQLNGGRVSGHFGCPLVHPACPMHPADSPLSNGGLLATLPRALDFARRRFARCTGVDLAGSGALAARIDVSHPRAAITLWDALFSNRQISLLRHSLGQGQICRSDRLKVFQLSHHVPLAACRSFASGGSHVLVRAEEVRRVILVLEFDQARVVAQSLTVLVRCG